MTDEKKDANDEHIVIVLASPAISRASRRFWRPGTHRPYSPPSLALWASRMEEQSHLPLSTHSLPVHAHASRKERGQVRLHERITAAVRPTVRGSATVGACGLVAEGQRVRRGAATHHPAMPRLSQRVAACVAPRLV